MYQTVDADVYQFEAKYVSMLIYLKNVEMLGDTPWIGKHNQLPWTNQNKIESKTLCVLCYCVSAEVK